MTHDIASVVVDPHRVTRSERHTLMGEWSGPGTALTVPDLADPAERTDMANRTCSMDGCEARARARGLCGAHYQAAQKAGTLERFPRERSTGATADRLLARRIIPENGCWEWAGHRSDDGYGVIRLAGHSVKVHRAAHETWIGPVPDGLQIDHLCRNKACFNPAHLEAVTFAENMRRRGDAITHCAHGHPYDELNTYVYKNGRKACRACVRANGRRYYSRKKAKGT